MQDDTQLGGAAVLLISRRASGSLAVWLRRDVRSSCLQQLDPKGRVKKPLEAHGLAGELALLAFWLDWVLRWWRGRMMEREGGSIALLGGGPHPRLTSSSHHFLQLPSQPKKKKKKDGEILSG